MGSGGLTPARVLALQRQVGNRAAGRVLARAMKFELQTVNPVWRERAGKWEKLPRKFGPQAADYLHKGEKGRPSGDNEGTAVELQSETGGVVEFETAEWFSDWCALKETIQEAVDMTTEINRAPTVGRRHGHDLVEFPWKVGHLKWRKKAFPTGLRQDEKLYVELVDRHWWAAVQSSESIALSQYEDFLKEHHSEQWSRDVIRKADELVAQANPRHHRASELGNLRSFLEVIVEYITSGQHDWGYLRTHGEHQAPKEYLPLMARTSFSSMYRELLSPRERTLFDQLVHSGAILRKMRLTRRSLFYAHGVQTHLRGLTVDSWLRSISEKGRLDAHNRERRREKDKLSEPTEGNAMGRFDVDTDPGEEDTMLVRFETRATRQARRWGDQRHRRSVKAADWVAYAEERFREAHRRRNRRGSTKLKYKPEKCPTVPPRAPRR